MKTTAPTTVVVRDVAFSAEGRRLEGRVVLPRVGADAKTAIVLLHEGLGCVALWRDFPLRVAEATGRTVVVYSRAGYGASEPVPLPRPLDYMQEEGRRALGPVLDQAGVREAVLVGHSDGGSIALVHAAEADRTGRIKGLFLLAPHVFCEEVSVHAITEAKRAYEMGDLRARLAKYHGANVDVAFWGWNRAWLDPGFRAWDLTPLLPRVRAAVVVVQGEDDPYGTLAQVDAIEKGVAGAASFRRVILPGAGHAPWREHEQETLVALRLLCDACLP